MSGGSVLRTLSRADAGQGKLLPELVLNPTGQAAENRYACSAESA